MNTVSSAHRELVDESFELERMGNALFLQGKGRVTQADVAELSDRYDAWIGKVHQARLRGFFTGLQIMTFGGNGRAFLRKRTREEYGTGFAYPVHKLRTAILEAEDAAAGFEPYGGMPEGVTRPSVFVVHGRNERYLAETTRALRELGANPTVLRQQPNQGRTIIEKFEEHADEVDFAVALLAADDRGGLTERDEASLQPRARQNVIYELGFFHAKLGRGRVCALLERGVEKPSDYDGVLYVPLDDPGRWKIDMGRELRASGLPVRLARVRV